MTNPWMSAWLSAANRTTGAARGQISAEMSRAQTRMMQDWQKAWIETWMAMWFPWLNQGATSRKRGARRGTTPGQGRARVPSTGELARIANAAKPGKLVLTHLLLYGQPVEQVLKEIRAEYPDEVVAAKDLDTF